MINRIFIVDSSDPNLDTIINYCVQDLSTCRERKDGLKKLVYLYPYDETNYPELAGYVEYTKEQMKLFLNDEDWTGSFQFE
jgi:hypothetical protein